MPAHGREDFAQHVIVEPLGLDVVARAVIAIEQENIVPHMMDGGMPEGNLPQGHGEKPHDGFMGDPSKGEDCAQLLHGVHLLFQPGAACGDFGAGRFVEGREARDGIGNDTIAKTQPVVGIFGIGAFRESELAEHSIEDSAGKIPGKGPAGSVCSGFAGG